MSVKAPQRRAWSNLAPEDVGLDPPRQHLAGLVGHELACRDGEDVVELLERALLGLGHEEEDHDEGDEVEAGVEAEGAGGRHGGQHTWEGDGKDGGPEEASSDGPGHADFAVGEGEDFGGVGEGDGAFARGVEGGKLGIISICKI